MMYKVHHPLVMLRGKEMCATPSSLQFPFDLPLFVVHINIAQTLHVSSMKTSLTSESLINI